MDMKDLFSVETPVLSFRASREKRKKLGPGQRNILWPTYAFRLVAPIVQERKLNLFQKAVLGLCSAGVKEPTVIGRHLHLHADLVGRILSELQERSYIDSQGHVTLVGEQTLQSELGIAVQAHSMVVGYVFQDPWSRRLWPCFVREENLEFAQYQYDPDTGRYAVLWGTPGQRTPRNVFRKRVDRAYSPSPPSVGEILDDCLAGRSWQTAQQDFIERISLISPDPQPMLLLSRLYLTDVDLDTNWYAQDPFGPGASQFFRSIIQNQMDHDNVLRALVEKLINSAAAEERRKRNNLFHEKAHSALARNLGNVFDAPFYDAIQSRLMAVEIAWQQVSDNDPTMEQLEDLATRVGKLMESLFGWLCQQSRSEQAVHVLQTADRQFRQELIEAVAHQIGFRGPFPPSLTHVNPGGVARAANDGRATLGQQIVAVLFAARADQVHPMRSLAERDPGLLQSLGSIIELRNMSSHHGESEIKADHVSNQVRAAYYIVSLTAEATMPK